MRLVLPSTAHALLSMLAAICGVVSTNSQGEEQRFECLPTGAIAMGGGVDGGVL
jgi:hypothetical protein